MRHEEHLPRQKVCVISEGPDSFPADYPKPVPLAVVSLDSR